MLMRPIGSVMVKTMSARESQAVTQVIGRMMAEESGFRH